MAKAQQEELLKLRGLDKKHARPKSRVNRSRKISPMLKRVADKESELRAKAAAAAALSEKEKHEAAASAAVTKIVALESKAATLEAGGKGCKGTGSFDGGSRACSFS